MATLYEIDQAILDCIDFETGEIIDADKLSKLQIEREKKIESVALWIKNLTADAAAYKAEKDSFAEKERVAKNKIESLKNWLTSATDGVKFSTAKVNVSFRKSESVEFDDEGTFIDWALRAQRDDLLTYKEPVPNKTAIKTAIKAALDEQEPIPFVEIVEKQNIQIK